MKKDKQHIREALLEGVLEIVFTLLFFGIGAFIISSFGLDLDSPSVDFDLIVLIGILVFFVALAAASFFVTRIKKHLKKKHMQERQ